MYGLVYAGHVEHEPAENHLELVFSGTGYKADHVFLPDANKDTHTDGLITATVP